MIFFFFQAEDGIRDLTVTGVQTCALPIYPRARAGPRPPGSVRFGVRFGTPRARDTRGPPHKEEGRGRRRGRRCHVPSTLRPGPARDFHEYEHAQTWGPAWTRWLSCFILHA